MSGDANNLNKSEAANILQPGQNIKPNVDASVVEKLVSSLYGLKATKVKELNGYDDKNFFVEVDNEHRNPFIQQVHPDGYIFKVLNVMDSLEPGAIDAQNEMILHMHKKGFNVTVPVQNLQGKYKSSENVGALGNGEDKWHIVRLLAFLPGKILYDVPCTNDICYKVGKYVAQFDKALKDFYHPTYDSRQFLWMLSNAPQVKKFAFAVQDPQTRKMVMDTLEEFENRVLPIFEKLPKAMIHGDVNEQNVVVRTIGDSQSTQYEVHGMIDFGDSQFNCRICEVVLATTYLMIQGTDKTFLELSGSVLAGYTSEEEISSQEWDILKTCIETRYCQSLVMGAYTNSQQPSNTYVLATAKNGWTQFKILRSMSNEQLQEIWRAIIAKRKN